MLFPAHDGRPTEPPRDGSGDGGGRRRYGEAMTLPTDQIEGFVAALGLGLMIGVEFAPATQGLATLVTAGVVNDLSRRYLTALVVMQLLADHQILSGVCVNNLNVLRLSPALIVEREDLDHFVRSLEASLQSMQSFVHSALQKWPLLLRALLS